MSLATVMSNNTMDVHENVEESTKGSERKISLGGPKSNMFECIHILGSPFWTQPLRMPENKYKQMLAQLEPTQVTKSNGKNSISTYKASIPFAALFVAHEDIIVPRLPVERTSKTGYTASEVERILVKRGEEVVMTYLEIALLGAEEAFNNKFKYRGVDYGLTVSYKQKNFDLKQPKMGPCGTRIATPCLLATDGRDESAKKHMEMICRPDPMDPNKPLWGTTPRDLLYKARYENLPAGHRVSGRRRNSKRIENADAAHLCTATKAATNCREYLKSIGMKFDYNSTNANTSETDVDD